MFIILASVWTLIASLPIAAETETVTTSNTTREVYAQSIHPLNDAQRTLFHQGRSLVRQSWIIAPAMDREVSGLGPLYNRNACIACHIKNGRGHAPDGPSETLRAMLLRLSIPGQSTTIGGPKPHPAYGDQFNEFGSPGVMAEGRLEIAYTEHIEQLNGGETVTLRQPNVIFHQLAYGPLSKNIQTSARIAPSLHGMGLIEAITDSTILGFATQPKPGNIKGKINRVWDVEQDKTVIGRFGWKANVANLRQQIASALAGDMGLTSTIFPAGNCAEQQTACQHAPTAGQPEISEHQMQQLEFYHLALAVPQARQQQDPSVQRGKFLFIQSQCAACHIPQVTTGDFPQLSVLSGKTIMPYSDFLLHDMGPALADGRPDFLASGSEWRTPPLWGIGLANTVDEQAGFLHDGRARTLLEAILWHGGEAEYAKQQVKAMPAQDRQSLIDFLYSL